MNVFNIKPEQIEKWKRNLAQEHEYDQPFYINGLPVSFHQSDFLRGMKAMEPAAILIGRIEAAEELLAKFENGAIRGSDLEKIKGDAELELGKLLGILPSS